MDEVRFDALSQLVARHTDRSPAQARLSRRLMLGGLFGSGLGVLLGVNDGGAKRKKKNKKKRPVAPTPCEPGCVEPRVCRGGECFCPDGREECLAVCCAANERCKGGECVPTQCAEPCPGEKVCQDGVCTCPNDRNECRDDVCCGEGEICSGGQCAPCASVSCDGLICGTVQNGCGDKKACGTCGENQVCNHGVCVGECPAEHRICDSECFPEAFCCADAECVGNLRCIGGICGCPDGRVECNGRCCGDREDCINGVCKRFECEKEFPGLMAYCGPYPYNCCNEPFMCCNRVHGMINVCCFPETAICCAAPGGCCDRD